MKRAHMYAWIAVAVIVVSAAAFWWFWSLGKEPVSAPQRLILAIEKGTVLIHSGGELEEEAHSGMELTEGDVLRTAEGSSASILAYDRADVRLDEKTTLKIETAKQPTAGMALKIKVETGRAWSRILRLLDLDSSFEARTDQSVATVRGTAFALRAIDGRTEILVDHAGVRLVPAGNSAKPVFVVGGEWADFGNDGKLIQRGLATSGTWSNDGWVQRNREADKKFAEAAQRNMAAALGAADSIAPDDWDAGLATMSENLHLWFAGERAPELYGKYLARRLGHVRGLMERGKSGLAFVSMTEIENELGQKLGDGTKKAYRQGIRRALGQALLAADEDGPGSSMYRLKLRLEDAYARAWEEDAAQAFYARALAVDARLDEAEKFDCMPSVDAQMNEALNAVEQGIAREKSETGKIESVPKEIRNVLTEKMDIQQLRLDHLRQRLEACNAPASDSSGDSVTATSTTSTTQGSAPTSTNTSVTTSTPNTDKPTVTDGSGTKPPATEQPGKPLGLTRIELFAQPNPCNVGDRVTLYVKGYTAGGTIDATTYAKFSVVGSLGVLSGATFTAQKPGSVTLRATVSDGGMSFDSSVSLPINQGPVALSRLVLTARSLQVMQGQTTVVFATAYYTNGLTKDVTSLTKFGSGGLGVMSGSTFTAGTGVTGWNTVTGSYIEDGVTRSGTVDIEVVPYTVGTNLR